MIEFITGNVYYFIMDNLIFEFGRNKTVMSMYGLKRRKAFIRNQSNKSAVSKTSRAKHITPRDMLFFFTVYERDSDSGVKTVSKKYDYKITVCDLGKTHMRP